MSQRTAHTPYRRRLAADPAAAAKLLDGDSRWNEALRSSLVVANRLRAVPLQGAFLTAVNGLAGAGGIHAYWALGGTWPGVDRIDFVTAGLGSVGLVFGVRAIAGPPSPA
ncbi:MAG: hypothetical protein WKF82_13760 [Nocardioidaceae bacterium]